MFNIVPISLSLAYHVNLFRRVDAIRTPENYTWKSQCKEITIPRTNYLAWGASWIFGSEGNCEDSFLQVCLQMDLNTRLLFTNESPDIEKIKELDREEILKRINIALEKDKKDGTNIVAKLLGNIKIDSEGRIIGASATKMEFITKTNVTEAQENPIKNQSTPVTKASLLFEYVLRDTLLEAAKDLDQYEMAVFVYRGFDDVINENILGNYNLLYSGFSIMFVYVLIMLGKFNCVEQRVWLSIAGLSGIVMGSVFCLGLCSSFGIMFTQLHNVLPFLMLGIGIDDMFVLVQSYENLTKEEKKLSLEERFGKALSYAGMAVSVTSLTNIVAFTLGATTVIPALRSFCLFCSVGILAIFIYTLTFFTACMVLDQRRIDERRDGCFVCFTHSENWSPNELSKRNLVNCFFEKLAAVMSQNIFFKVTVSLTAIAVFGFSCYGITQLEQRFEERWLIPDDSYLAGWFDDREQYFGQSGERGTIYFTGENGAALELTNTQLDKIQALVKSLTNETDVITEVDQWAVQFSERYYDGSLRENSTINDQGDVSNVSMKLALQSHEDDPVDNSYMIKRLGKYLQTQEGLQFRDRFYFANNTKPSCVGQELPPLVMFKIEFQHPLFKGPTEHVPAMERVHELVKNAGIVGRVFARADKYDFWEVDGILSQELIRSIVLALVCVFFIVVFMLANIIAAILVLLCVIFTLVDVMGFMYFWGLTIDTTTSMLLIVCIGLSVDYAAHIAHGFLEESEKKDAEGSKLQKNRARAQATLTKYNSSLVSCSWYHVPCPRIGPAVLYGGLSTMLATVLLAFSDYYLFTAFFKVRHYITFWTHQTFFQVFLLVVTFGLFHGLVFLPVLLCLVKIYSSYYLVFSFIFRLALPMLHQKRSLSLWS